MNIIAEVIRNDRVESVHCGIISVVTPQGSEVTSLGDTSHRTYIRSAAKPFQIMPLIENGAADHFQFTNKELAVMMASHSGEDFHVKTVADVLEKINLKETDLQCGFHHPLHKAAANSHIENRRERSPLYNNCSGKHSGMLAQSKFHNWDLETYLQPDHPVQKKIKRKISLFADLPEEEIHVGVDGCSAPVFFLPILKMAQMYAKLAAGVLEPADQVFEIMSSNPEMIGGTDRFDTDLMKVMKGRMVSKIGAEGISCLGVRGEKSFGIALKVSDGGPRASSSVMLEILKQLDLTSEEELKELEKYRSPKIINHSGIETGRLDAKFSLKI